MIDKKKTLERVREIMDNSKLFLSEWDSLTDEKFEMHKRRFISFALQCPFVIPDTKDYVLKYAWDEWEGLTTMTSDERFIMIYSQGEMRIFEYFKECVKKDLNPDATEYEPGLICMMVPAEVVEKWCNEWMKDMQKQFFDQYVDRMKENTSEEENKDL